MHIEIRAWEERGKGEGGRGEDGGAMRTFMHSKKSSLRTKPRCDAARANVCSALCVRPIPPPTTMLKPLSVWPSGSMMTTQPMSLMYLAVEGAATPPSGACGPGPRRGSGAA